MIATSRRSASRPAISRHHEFSRLQDRILASAYEALIPAVSRRAGCRTHRCHATGGFTSVHRSSRRSVAGA